MVAAVTTTDERAHNGPEFIIIEETSLDIQILNAEEFL